MSSRTIVSLTAVLLLGAATVALYAQNQALERRLVALEGRSAAMTADAEAGGALPALGGEPVAASLARIDGAMERLSGRLAETEARIDARGEARPSEGGGRLDLEAPAFDEKVRDIVLDMTGDVRFREKLGLRGAPSLPKKPAFGALAEVLELDAAQEDAMRKDLLELKEGFLAIISMERDDGVVLLEEIQRVEALPEHDPKRAQTFMRLFTLKIPGSEQTYVNRLVEMTSAMRRKAEDYLRPAQVKRFNGLDIDLMGVDID